MTEEATHVAARPGLWGLSLCSGVGGLELGIRIALPHYITVGMCEREAYPAAAVVARMEEQTVDPAPIWDDLETFDGRPWSGVVDIVSAGFPCQPFSNAGKQRGTKDERWLWPIIERILGEIRPRWVFLENVPGLVRHGLGPVLSGLAGLGYDAEWDSFSAEAVGAPHRRERFFLFAWRISDPERDTVRLEPERRGGATQATDERNAESRNMGAGMAYPDDDGLQRIAGTGRQEKRGPEFANQPVADASDGDGRTGERGAKTGVGQDGERGGRPTGGSSGVAISKHEGRGVSSSTHDKPERSDATRDDAHGCDPGVADARRSGLEGRDGYPEERGDGSESGTAGPVRPGGGKVANTESRGRRELGSEKEQRGGGYAHGGDAWRLFPPGPDDLELWAEVLAETPEVEPAICGMAHGVAGLLDYRAERLRACGNGVQPLAAAVALVTLADRAGVLSDLMEWAR